METPPSTPPPLQKGEMPSLPNVSLSLSPETKPMMMEEEDNQESNKKRGHIRMTTPSTPIPEEAYAQEVATPITASTAGGGGGGSGVRHHQNNGNHPNNGPQLFSTPSRSGVGLGNIGSTGALHHHHHHGPPPRSSGHHLTSDLTPVIRNSGMYVDAHMTSNSANKPGMPGLTAASSSTSHQRRSHMPLPRAGLPPAYAAAAKSSPPLATGTATGGGGAASGASTPTNISVGSILRMHSTGSSDSSLLGGDHLRISPSTPLSIGSTPLSNKSGGTESSDNDGLGALLGERLPMPSYGSLYSEDESSLDDSSNNRNSKNSIFNKRGGANNNNMANSIFNERLLAPIELKPDRKFFSFQGASQYKRAVGEKATTPVVVPRRLETISSPSRGGGGGGRSPPTTSEEQERDQAHRMMPPQSPSQYQPMLRSQHGVTEMADTKDLDAIFKAPRTRSNGQQTQQQHPNVVSPYKLAPPPPMLVDKVHQPPSHPQPMLSRINNEINQEAEGGEDVGMDNHQLLAQPYPVEDRQFSIPSIHLATHINQSSTLLGGSHPLENSFASYASFTEYTDDGASLDESYYTNDYYDDDDTASLSSRGSVDASVRRRRISYGMMQFRRQASLEAAAASVSNDAEGPPQTANGVVPPSPMAPPAIAQSNSFVEKMQGISIETSNGIVVPTANAAAAAAAAPTAANNNVVDLPPQLPQRSQTFDYEHPSTVFLNVPAHDHDAMDDDDIDYYQRNNHRGDGGRRSSRRRRRGSRRRRKEGAAVEWLQDLQNQSKLGGGSGGDGGDMNGGNVLIVEAASSKFLIGDHHHHHQGGGMGMMAVGGSGEGTNGPKSGIGGGHNVPSSEDVVSKALGMPHPLCRSSTIEAGPFVNRAAGGVFGSRNNGGNNGIALTSSGSGD